MTLREEVLKHSGLLTEMPVLKTMETHVTVTFFDLVFDVDNDKMTLYTNDDADSLTKEELYNYVTKATSAKIITYDRGIFPLDRLQAFIEVEGAEFFSITGNDAKDIIKYVIRLSGKKQELIKKFENDIKEAEKAIESYNYLAKRGRNMDDILSDKYKQKKDYEFAKSFIEKYC